MRGRAPRDDAQLVALTSRAFHPGAGEHDGASPPTLVRRSVLGRPEAPLRPHDVVALQRLVGNAAVVRSVQRLGPDDELRKLYSSEKSLKSPKKVVGALGKIGKAGQEGTKNAMKYGPEALNAGIGVVDKTTSQIDKATGQETLPQFGDESISAGTETLGDVSAGVGESGLSEIGSMVGLGIGVKELSSARQIRKIGEQEGKGHLARVGERRVNKAGGDIAKNTAGTIHGGIEVGKTGVELAGTIGTMTSTVAETTSGALGVVGSSVALPIHVVNLARQSRRAELQRQRANRVAKQATLSTNRTSPEEVLTEKKALLEQAEQGARESDERLAQLEEQVAASDQYLADLAQRLGALGEVPEGASPGMRQRMAGQRKSLEAKLEAERRARQSLDSHRERLRLDNAIAHRDLEKAREDLTAQQQINTKLSEGMEESSKLTTDPATGKVEKDSGLPSLAEIAEYAVKKNRRGHSRRAIKATLAGLGVAGGAIGLAAGIMKLTGDSGDTVKDLGIASAAIGGAALVAGLGVGIWKMVNWAKKRKKQAAAMKAHGDKLGTGVLNPLNKEIDQKVKRRHYATALVSYATRGDAGQRDEAHAIMKALDPKFEWSETLKEELPPAEQRHLVQHFMDKMGSGG